MISDTFSFVDDLRNSNIVPENVFMDSLDVNALFINVHLDETIDITIGPSKIRLTTTVFLYHIFENLFN